VLFDAKMGRVMAQSTPQFLAVSFLAQFKHVRPLGEFDLRKVSPIGIPTTPTIDAGFPVITRIQRTLDNGENDGENMTRLTARI
jgi:hypothetical protein